MANRELKDPLELKVHAVCLECRDFLVRKVIEAIRVLMDRKEKRVPPARKAL